ncbi:MAG: hypothetical protein E6J87_21135, partial [Deltaproteobacteria bacterium]
MRARDAALGDRAREHAALVARGRRDRAGLSTLVSEPPGPGRAGRRLHGQDAAPPGRACGRGLARERPRVSFRTLQEFIAACEARGDVKRVTREVDWRCEVTEIACREARAQGPLLLFENVRGARFPLAVNVLAATRRIEWALGRTARAVGGEIEEIFHALPPRSLGDLWGLKKYARRVLASRPARLASGPAQEH